tara:strand:- start:54 stop:251 length:198 start_codon:yes stop_codon:yes gene_type:complete
LKTFDVAELTEDGKSLNCGLVYTWYHQGDTIHIRFVNEAQSAPEGPQVLPDTYCATLISQLDIPQ